MQTYSVEGGVAAFVCETSNYGNTEAPGLNSGNCGDVRRAAGPLHNRTTRCSAGTKGLHNSGRAK